MMMIEARRAERVRSFLRARIIFNNQNSTIDCTIKNFSAFGAKIDLAETTTIPDAFDLEVPQKGRTFRARLSWRDQNAIGVEFVEDEPVTRDGTDKKVERLERENRMLRNSIAQLTKRLEDLGQAVSFT